jgi:hypothetical protein
VPEGNFECPGWRRNQQVLKCRLKHATVTAKFFDEPVVSNVQHAIRLCSANNFLRPIT